MTEPLRLRIHVSEPFDFERENGFTELFGTTGDDDGDSERWEVVLEAPFQFNEVDYDRVLIAPRYVGEHLDKVHDALLGMPVRIAHRIDEEEDEEDGDGWYFAMTGILAIAPPPSDDAPQ